MEDATSLKALLEEERRQRHLAEQRAVEADQRAVHAVQLANQAVQRAEDAERRTRKTTLKEYLEACQTFVLSKIVLNTDGYLTTKVPSTNLSKKHCPRLIKPWHDFVAQQQRINERIDRIIPRDARLFESVHFLQAFGERVHARQVYREADLTFVHNNAIEDPVRIILDQMKQLQPERQDIVLHGGVRFQTTAENLRSDMDDTITARDKRLLTDQICVLRGDQEDSVAYVIEYKAPRRLHTIHFDKGLRPMSILDDVVNKPTIPNYDPGKSQHYAELLTAAALTQTYHYMLEAGLEYGCVANGDVFVFLYINWSDPSVLYYHLAQPSREVDVDGDPAYSNAVCQLLAFTVLALQSPQHGNDLCVKATRRAGKWEVDFDELVEKIITAESSTTSSGKKHRRLPSSPEWLPTPIRKRQRGPQQTPETGSERVLRSHTRRDDEPGSGPGGGASGSVSGSRAGGATGGDSGGGSGSGSGSDDDGQSGSISGISLALNSARAATDRQPRPYCTPLCLLSLVHGRALDRKCPNAALHRAGQPTGADQKAGSPQKHPVSYPQWMALLRTQLAKSLESGVVVLRKEGSCGAVFQITLLQYGYTFVAKGGTELAVRLLQHEEAVYGRLRPLQGRCIPVCIGSVDLRPLDQVYFYKIGVRLVYFLLLSYGGAGFETRPDAATEERLVARLRSVVHEMHSLGVVHGDIRLPNVLLSPAGNLTVIDFDRAQLLPVSDHEALAAVSPNGRKRLRGPADGDTSDKKNNAPMQAEQIVKAVQGRQWDRSNAETLFTFDLGRTVGWTSR